MVGSWKMLVMIRRTLWGWTHDEVMSVCRRSSMVSVGRRWSVSLWWVKGMGECVKILIVR